MVIPALNEATFLPSLLSHLSPVSPPIKEIIVVDGQSSDDTVIKALSYKITLIHSEPGVAKQRSLGCLRATGDYVLLLDADTQISISEIKQWVSLAQARKLEISVPTYLPMTSSNVTRYLFAFLNTLFRVSASVKPSGAGCGILIKRKVINDVLFDPRSSFDDLAFIRRTAKSFSFGVVKDIQLKVSDRRFREEGWIGYGKYLVLSLLFCFDIFIASSIISYRFGAHEPQSSAS